LYVSHPFQSNCRNKTRHGYLRRVINAAFSPASLKQLEATMIGYFDQFISGIVLQAESDGLVDLNLWFHSLAFDVLQPQISIDCRSPER
jgi:cytochrome P450